MVDEVLTLVDAGSTFFFVRLLASASAEPMVPDDTFEEEDGGVELVTVADDAAFDFVAKDSIGTIGNAAESDVIRGNRREQLKSASFIA